MAKRPPDRPSPAGASAPDPYPLLKQRIFDGEFPPGEKLPSLRELAKHYNTSLTTLHHVIRRLEQENFVQVRHGSGVYAADFATRPLRILLLNPVEGDHWADFTRAFTQALGADAHVRLLIEAPLTCPEGVPNTALESKVRAIVKEGVDLIVFNGQIDFGLSFLREYVGRVPLISFLLDQVLRGQPCARVLSDWHHGGYAGMRHLIETGCRRIVLTHHIHAALEPLSNFLAGARLAAAESVHRIDILPMLASVSDPVEEVLARFREVVLHDQPDGVFAHADWVGSRLLTDLRRNHVRVPEEVAVLGYLDTPWTMMTDPPMSSITPDPLGMVEAIRGLIMKRQFEEQIVIKPRLVIRESTRAKNNMNNQTRVASP